MISAILFDMNGVITDDEDCHELATKRAFETVGLALTPDLYRTYCLGRTDVAAFKDLIETFDLPVTDKAQLIAKKTGFYLELIKDNLKVYPGVTALIRRLHGSFPLALTTSSTRKEADTVIDHLDLHGCFQTVVTSEDVVYGKPHPEPYLLTAIKMGVPPEKCMVIEDSENGLRSAKAAGMFCVCVTNTEKAENLKLADAIVKSYTAITDAFIKNLGLA